MVRQLLPRGHPVAGLLGKFAVSPDDCLPGTTLMANTWKRKGWSGHFLAGPCVFLGAACLETLNCRGRQSGEMMPPSSGVFQQERELRYLEDKFGTTDTQMFSGLMRNWLLKVAATDTATARSVCHKPELI